MNNYAHKNFFLFELLRIGINLLNWIRISILSLVWRKFVGSNGKRATVVQIVDMCPSCQWGALDISHQAMADLVGSYERATFLGVLSSANWTQVDCSILPAEAFFTQVNPHWWNRSSWYFDVTNTFELHDLCLVSWDVYGVERGWWIPTPHFN